jgi:hypothetical protein
MLPGMCVRIVKVRPETSVPFTFPFSHGFEIDLEGHNAISGRFRIEG